MLPRFKRLIRHNLSLHYNGPGPAPARYLDCFATVDGKRFPICRPSGRNNQQAGAYNGYYRNHNLGFQAITGPNGMFLHFSGPHAGAGNDLDMLADSQALQLLNDALGDYRNDGERFDILADAIYPQIRGDGIVSLRQGDRTVEEEAEDSAASVVRTHVEHSFAKIVNIFPFVDFKKGLKLNEREIGKYMVVGALFTNLHTCLYGSQVCNQFSYGAEIILPPTLEEYMSM
jgi:nuclease HARBI1